MKTVMFHQIVQILFKTFNAVFSVFLDFLPTAKVLLDLKAEMIALILGVPVTVLTILKYLIKMARILNGHK